MNFLHNISQQFRMPGSGFYGALARAALMQTIPMSRMGINRLQIEPHQNMMEIGFGYGKGLKFALDGGLREGSGKLYGVDFSKQAYEVIKNKYAADINTGKLSLFNEDAANMSLPDSIVDKVFHSNVYYYFPDMQATCTEIKRVMRPGGKMLMMTCPFRVRNFKKLKMLQCAFPVTSESYAEAAEKAGFTDVKIEIFERGPFKDNFLGVWSTKPFVQEV